MIPSGSESQVSKNPWQRYKDRATRSYQGSSLLKQRKVRALINLYPIFTVAALLFIVLNLVFIGYSPEILVIAVGLVILFFSFPLLLAGYFGLSTVILIGLVLVEMSMTVFVGDTHEPLRFYTLTVFCIISLLVAGLVGESTRYGYVVGVLSLVLLTVYLIFFVIPVGSWSIELILDAYLASLVLVGLSTMISVAMHKQINRLIEEQSQANLKLDSMVTTRTRQFEEAQRKLIESEKLSALGGVVSGMAHEINTPLGSSVTVTSHLRSELNDFRKYTISDTPTIEDLEEFLETCESVTGQLESNLNRLRNLVGNFRKVSVIPSPGGPEVRNISAELKSIVKFFREQIEHKRNVSVTISGKSDLDFNICPDCFRQIISQLLDNALIHAFPMDSGLIDIGFEVKGDDLILDFRDDGVGISSDLAGKVFEPFFTTDRGHGKLGLGMTVVHNTAQKIGGDVSIESIPGKGTTIRVRFPREPVLSD